jgi:hypothetical protein
MRTAECGIVLNRNALEDSIEKMGINKIDKYTRLQPLIQLQWNRGNAKIMGLQPPSECKQLITHTPGGCRSHDFLFIPRLY